MLGSVQPGWDRAVRSSHEKVLEGCEDQPKDFVSSCKHRSYIHGKMFVVILVRGISYGWAFQSPHLVAILRLEGWVEERAKAEGQGHSRSEEMKV